MPRDPGPFVLYAAGLLVALGVLWRGLFRPLHRFTGTVRDIIEQWRQTQESVHELVHQVAGFTVESDRRLTRLEALRDLDTITRERQAEDTETLLGRELVRALLAKKD